MIPSDMEARGRSTAAGRSTPHVQCYWKTDFLEDGFYTRIFTLSNEALSTVKQMAWNFAWGWEFVDCWVADKWHERLREYVFYTRVFNLTMEAARFWSKWAWNIAPGWELVDCRPWIRREWNIASRWGLVDWWVADASHNSWAVSRWRVTSPEICRWASRPCWTRWRQAGK